MLTDFIGEDGPRPTPWILLTTRSSEEAVLERNSRHRCSLNLPHSVFISGTAMRNHDDLGNNAQPSKVKTFAMVCHKPCNRENGHQIPINQCIEFIGLMGRQSLQRRANGRR